MADKKLSQMTNSAVQAGDKAAALRGSTNITVTLGTAAGSDVEDFDAAGTATSVISDHVVDADPHSQYLTQTEGDALYSAISTNRTLGSVSIGIYNNGSVLTAQTLPDSILIPYSGTITGWEITGDTTGSVVFDIWKDTYANFPPTIADTLINTGAGGTKPTISNSTKAVSSSLSNWTTSISAGDYLKIKIDSVSNFTYLLLTLKITKSV